MVLFDPDWNPMTDMQSRERAWRLGQKREVCNLFEIYDEVCYIVLLCDNLSVDSAEILCCHLCITF